MMASPHYCGHICFEMWKKNFLICNDVVPMVHHINGEFLMGNELPVKALALLKKIKCV